MIPSTGIPKRISALFSRRPTTAWSEKEIAAYKKLAKAGYFDDPTDLELVTLYYQTERKKERGIHRRDLLTFLNHFPGELDRARQWREKIKRNPKGYGSPIRQMKLGPATDEDFKVAGAEAKKLIESLRNQLKPVPEN